MPQLFPNPISSNSGITINTGDGLTGGGTVTLGGSLTIASAVTSSTGNRNCYAVSPAANGVAAQFTVVNPLQPLPLYVDVYVAGILQQPNIHYTVSGTVITFVTPPLTGQAIWVVYAVNDARSMFYLTPNPATGVATTFSFPTRVPQAAYIDVYIDGVYQIPTIDYALNYIAGVWHVIFVVAPGVNSVVFAVYDNTVFLTRENYNVTPISNSATTQFLLTGGTPTSLYVDVYVNRSFVSPLADYTLNLYSGVWKMDFSVAPPTGQLVSVVF